MSTFNDYIKKVRAGGKQYFTADQALKDLQISKNSLYLAIHRRKKKGELISPANNLYVIIPPEYQPLGCIPAEDLIPILMKHWQLEYYACLQTAALYHGASHQKPQLFQVMTNKQITPLSIGKVRIEFIYKKSLSGLPTQTIVAKSGYLKISSPELTAMDLLLYPNHSGGLNHIATILSELVEAIDHKRLIALARLIKEKAWLQRLGFLLDHIDTMAECKKNLIINYVQRELESQRLFYMPLATELATKGCPRNKKWMIVENTNLESDNDT
jgi:predicted transcriptional regulator of viral defense system